MVTGQFFVLIEVIFTAIYVFKWTKDCLYDIGLRVIVVVGHHLVVNRLAEVRAGRCSDNYGCKSRKPYDIFHFPHDFRSLSVLRI